MYYLKMSEIQKAYYIGRNDNQSGGVGTHVYVECLYNGTSESFQKTLNKIIAAQPFFRAKPLPTFEFCIEDNLKYDVEVINKPASDFDAIQSVRNEYEEKLYTNDDYTLFSAKLIGNENNYRICFSIDMLIADGISLYQLCSDLTDGIDDPNKTYEDQTENLKYMVSYYHDSRLSKRYSKSKDYYIKNLENLYPAPYLCYSENTVDSKFEHLEYQFEKEYMNILNKKSETLNMSVNNIIYTIFSIVIARWSRYRNFSINMTTFTRPKEEKYMKVIGDFTTSMLVQTKIDFSKSFSENALNAKKAIYNAFKYRNFEVTEIVREMNKTSGGVLMPIVYTSMLFENSDLEDDNIKIDYWRSQTPQVYLDCQMKNVNGSINATWDYRSCMFNKEIIESMFDDFKKLIISFCQNDEDIILNYIKNSNSNLVNRYFDYNETNEFTLQSSNEKLKDRFIKNVQALENKNFVSTMDRSYTFKEIYNSAKNRAEEIAKTKKESSKNKTRLVFKGYKNIESIINIIAAIISGDSFCVLNAEYSAKKTDEILKELANTIYYDGENLIPSKNNCKIPDDESYVLFTSGTTGKAKGIIIEEKSVMNTIDTINKMFSVTCDDVLFNISNLYFDLSIYDIFASMVVGSEFILADAVTASFKASDIKRITIWNSTPALAKEFALKYNLENIRLFLMSGDFVPKKLVKELFEKYGENTKIVSLGGATEASVWSNYYDCKDYDKVSVIPYGLSLHKQQLYVINPDDNLLCGPNVVGEICIGGNGLALGYIDAEQTKEAFVYNKSLNDRVYKTGDLGYFGDDGYIYIIGRVAQEIKHNGYRIDLKEIENFIADIDYVSMAVVILEKTNNNRTRLSAVVESNDRNIEQRVRDLLSNNFPHYMVPSKLIITKHIPITDNGKVDKSELVNWLNNTETEDVFTEEEKALLNVWKKVIGKENYADITSRDNTYFDAGGQSLQAVELTNEIKNSYGIDISLQDIISHISLRTMTELVSSLKLKDNIKDDGDLINEIPEAHGIFDKYGKVYDKIHSYDKNIFVNNEELEKFKNKVKSRVVVNATNNIKIDLINNEWPNVYSKRHSVRNFDTKKVIPFKIFCGLLNILSQRNGRYAYPSAGGLYPIDCYISVKENRVENVEKGTYYYSPLNNKLILVNRNVLKSDAHYFTNKSIYNSSAFSLHMFFNINVSMPKYGGMAYYYGAVESGIISQLMTEQAEYLNLGSCIIGDSDVSKIKENIQVNDESKYLLSMEFGYEDSESYNPLGELVLLRKGTSDKNLVLIHPGSGQINQYLLIAQYIDQKYNIYGIKHIHNMDNILPGEYNFEILAHNYHKLISNLDTVDVIGGWCIGGTVAYEMSLIAPERYKKLLILNSKAPVREGTEVNEFTIETEIDLFKNYATFYNIVKECVSIEEVWGNILKALNQQELREELEGYLPNYLTRLLPSLNTLTPQQLVYYINHLRSSELSRYNYFGNGITKSKILYLVASEEPLEHYYDWQNYTESYQEIKVDGDHVSMYNPESLQVWCKYIEKYIES